MENLVLFIDQEKFVRNLMDELFKVKGSKIHTIDTIVDHYYLINDLRPSIIVFDVKTVGDELSKLLSHENVKFLAIGNEEDEVAVEGKVSGFISKPLVVRDLYERIFSVAN